MSIYCIGKLVGRATDLRRAAIAARADPQEVLASIEETPIGKFLSAFVRDPGAVAGGIALFDGGVRQIMMLAPPECLRAMLTGFLLPWDCGADALYAGNQDPENTEADPQQDGTP